ncbi:MAG: 5'/3'-nucleotidase SurE [Bacteroidales bacterium]|jgi:5'-nucleotidase
MTTNKPYILVSNDDGVHSKGIQVLADIASEFGEVMVFAPDTERSGQGHAVTVRSPLYANLVKEKNGIKYYSCSGTPVDCLKLAVKMFTARKPDIVISGINHGTNAGINVFYSGTMAVALESVFEGIPAIGFSLSSLDKDADFSEIIPYVRKIIEVGLKDNIPPHICWNVNMPYKPEGGIKGIKVCKMSRGFWNDEYERRVMPATNKDYFWIYGDYTKVTPNIDSDHDYNNRGYVSIVPVSIDVTDYSEVNRLEKEFE